MLISRRNQNSKILNAFFSLPIGFQAYSLKFGLFAHIKNQWKVVSDFGGVNEEILPPPPPLCPGRLQNDITFFLLGFYGHKKFWEDKSIHSVDFKFFLTLCLFPSLVCLFRGKSAFFALKCHILLGNRQI